MSKDVQKQGHNENEKRKALSDNKTEKKEAVRSVYILRKTERNGTYDHSYCYQSFRRT